MEMDITTSPMPSARLLRLVRPLDDTNVPRTETAQRDYNPCMAGNERTYQEDEYFDVGEEVARSWAEIENWKLSQRVVTATPAREIPNADDCPPNAIGRTHPTVGDIVRGYGANTLGGE